ncbi:MAG: hypothetical protein V1698_03460 [bacterium]
MRRRKNFIKFSSLIIIITIALAGFIFYFAFSKATITLKPSLQEKSTEKTITIDTQTSDIDLANSTIPGVLVAQEFEKTYEKISIQVKDISKKASGTITIFNNRDTQQYLLVESQLEGEKNAGITFLTSQEIIVPAKGKTEIAVIAKDSGTKGNIPPQKFNFIKFSTSMQSLVYAESSEAMKGGLDKGNLLTQEDIQKAQEDRQTDFFNFGRTEILKELEKSSKIIFKDLSKEEILESSSDIQLETETSEFNLKLKGRITAIAFNEEIFSSLLVSDLKNKTEKDSEEFINAKLDSLRILEAKNDWENAKSTVSARLTGLFTFKLPEDFIKKEQLIGLEKQEAIKYLESLPEIQSAEISFFPPWNSTIPGRNTNSIKIEIRNEF